MPQAIPPRQPDRLAAILAASALMTATPADFGMDAPAATAFAALVADFQDGVTASNTAAAAAKAATSVAQDADDAATLAFRALLNAARANPDVTDETLATVNASRRDSTPTAKPAPVDAPEFALMAVVPNQVTLTFRTAGSANPRARATNAIGIEIATVNAAAGIVAGEADTAARSFYSRTPAVIDTTGAPAKVRFYARWITQRGLKGPWSAPIPVSPN